MLTFIKFTEENDNEGETWNYYIQYDGNEVALERLGQIIDLDCGDSPYSIDLSRRFTEKEVDLLVENCGGNYMDDEQKFVGVLTLPKEPENKDDDWAWQYLDKFYKGQISNYIGKVE